MPSAPLIVTWPGGIGNPIGEQIPISGGRRGTRRMGCGLLRKSRRSNRRMGCGLLRKSRRSNRRMGCGVFRKSRRNTLRRNRKNRRV